ARLADVPSDYPEIAKKAVVEMHRQVGDLVVDGSGLARKGLVVRHLVLPEDLAGTKDIMRFLSNEVSRNTYVNIMSQYRPCTIAWQIEPLSRRISAQEYNDAVLIALEEGITRLDS
ncbi:MAG: radical SAM protein, partial [Desulfamplus sp.]|nr:radical SAM protein [Desulfamplus sp.]